MPARLRVPLLTGIAAFASAAAGILAVSSAPVRVEAGSPSWARLVRGAAADGTLTGRAVALFPGLDRTTPRQLLIELPPGAAATNLTLAVDGGPARELRVEREGALVVLPAARAPGARLDLAPVANQPSLRLSALAFERTRVRWLSVLSVAGFAAVLSGLLALRCGWRLGLSTGLIAASCFAIAFLPALLLLTLPEAQSSARLCACLLPAALAVVVARRGGIAADVVKSAALVAVLVFGAWVRIFFLPSTGSWDTEYWKAWMLRAVDHGLTQVYGDPGAVPPGHFWAQLSGAEPRFNIVRHGREFFVDYPPLAMALWQWSYAIVARAAPTLDGLERESVAVKLPAVTGDIAAVLALAWALRRTPARALKLAALYWALPVSWLSSAVLGFSDGAVAPFAMLALVASGQRRPVAAGVFLALACLVKPTAVIVAPAMATALLASGVGLGRASVAGASVALLSLVPYLLSGTFLTAVVHVYRILFQERLSGGFPNPWWLLGHLLTLDGGFSAPVKFAPLSLLPFPARPVGTLLFLGAAAFVASKHRGIAGSAPACLAGAALFHAYGLLAVGVHENHPHPLFLILAATALASPALKLFAAGVSGIYVLNMLMMSGLGRFHGLRYMWIEPWTMGLAGALRLGLGFDATLALTAVNIALFAFVLARLRRELLGLSAPGAAPVS
jgi:hypothetical protein